MGAGLQHVLKVSKLVLENGMKKAFKRLVYWWFRISVSPALVSPFCT